MNQNHPEPRVIVWDSRSGRREVANAVVSECGARPHWVKDLPGLREVDASLSCRIAFVGFAARPSPHDLGLDVIRALKQKECKVISYDDGAHSWPLAAQCQILLAGSVKLLDSASSEFPSELRRSLMSLLRTEALRREEEEKIRAVMNRLGIVGESEAMLSVFRRVLRLSPLSDLPVLILGETGTGKQLLADAIYRLDPKRRQGPFVAVNCGAISSSLAESELFGHRRGAFTGADRDRKGLVRSAQGGILFLDEIGELDDALQTKLLRVLQENRVLGVGEDEEEKVDVRVIAATNRDLDAMVGEKKFRADLFHRLNVLSLRVPPLRERRADIGPLVEHFVRRYQTLKPGVSSRISPDFLSALESLELPGNARELENLVRQALVQKEDESPLHLSDLPVEILYRLSQQAEAPASPKGRTEWNESDPSTSGAGGSNDPSSLADMLEANSWSLSRSLEHCERIFLAVALRASQGNQSRTARLVGITPRSMYNKIRKHNLHR